MIKYITAIIYLISITILSSCNSKITCTDLHKNYLTILNSLHTHQDTILFIEKLDKLINKTPKCLKALQTRGLFLIAESKLDFAKKDFVNALKIDSLNPYTLYYLGMLYNFENKNDIAYFYFNRAIQVKNKNGYVIDNNNFIYENLDIKYYQIIYFRGIVLFEKGQFQMAKNDFLSCINNHFEYDFIDGYLAAIYSAESKMDSACFFHNKSIISGLDNVIDSSLIKKCGK